MGISTWANRAMMHVLMKNNGTDKATLKQMIALKNALCEDFVNGNVEVDTFSKQVARELTAILQGENHATESNVI